MAGLVTISIGALHGDAGVNVTKRTCMRLVP
jgi:hypothetical protein